ncbi:unnamed protein product [Adineta steineri]|uniref:G-protein coupled receptors family 1 profile domain-containing protein n=1 Tax=Adineta steineri TaxID=433720 RepID=A0A819J857_9BILA|nr:unnamed protein product [Adineta steineri]CAF3819396.1 unnamed protein product [Adineta steineri]CAF3928932.1 unnamed protein product [Adineta steineri]
MTPSINDFVLYGQYVNKIGGIFLWFFGVFGSSSIIIIFSSKKELRRTSSSQYILVAAICDFIFLAIALGYRIMTDGFQVQGNIALFFFNPAVCRIRSYITGVTNFATLYTKCLCTIDQWASTSRSNKIRRFSSIKWAQLFLIINTFIWALMQVPQLLYNDISTSSSGVMSCVSTSKGLTYAFAYFLLPVLYFFIPFIILTIFGYLTYSHVKKLGQNSSNQSRFQRIERQLTSLIIAQTLVCMVTSLPYGVQYLYTGITLTQAKDPYRLALETFIQHVVRLNLYASSAAPFYVYVCLSNEIRRMAVELIFCKIIKMSKIAPSQIIDRTFDQTITIETHQMKSRNQTTMK